MEKLFTTKEIMDNYKVCRKTVLNWRKQGMPCFKIGGLIRFKENEIKEWIEQNK